LAGQIPAGDISDMDGTSEPPAKRRRISSDDEQVEVLAAAADFLKKPKPISKRFQPPALRKPLEVVKNPSGLSQSNDASGTNKAYFTVLW